MDTPKPEKKAQKHSQWDPLHTAAAHAQGEGHPATHPHTHPQNVRANRPTEQGEGPRDRDTQQGTDKDEERGRNTAHDEDQGHVKENVRKDANVLVSDVDQVNGVRATEAWKGEGIRAEFRKLREELENIHNPPSYENFREQEALKLIETVLSSPRARARAVKALESEIKRERRRAVRGQTRLIILVALLTYTVKKIQKSRGFRRRMVTLWHTKVVPGGKRILQWLNQRRKIISRALGPSAGPSRINSVDSIAGANNMGTKKVMGKHDKNSAGGEGSETSLFFSSLDPEVSTPLFPSHIPAAFCCPITRDVMKNPVIAADGHTYEKSAITEWLVAHNTSPTTNLKLLHKHVIPNHSLRSAIEEFQSKM